MMIVCNNGSIVCPYCRRQTIGGSFRVLCQIPSELPSTSKLYLELPSFQLYEEASIYYQRKLPIGSTYYAKDSVAMWCFPFVFIYWSGASTPISGQWEMLSSARRRFQQSDNPPPPGETPSNFNISSCFQRALLQLLYALFKCCITLFGEYSLEKNEN